MVISLFRFAVITALVLLVSEGEAQVPPFNGAFSGANAASGTPGEKSTPIPVAVPVAPESSDQGGSDKAPPSKRESVGMPQINIIDKLLSAEYALGPVVGRNGEEAWAEEYRRLYSTYKVDGNPGVMGNPGRVTTALTLGIKASDGVLALKGRDVEGLNDCAEQIEKLAGSLNVDPAFLQKANIVKHHARKNEWLEAFMNLGFLQHEVMRSLEQNPAQKDEALLVVVGGWLQGGRSITEVIAENYEKTPKNSKAHISNILREPSLVALMASELDKIDPVMKSDKRLVEIFKFLPGVQQRVNVGMYDPIPLDDVKWLHDNFNRLVSLIISPDSPGRE